MEMWHYEEAGSGRPLILLHGIGMSSRVWKPVIPILAQERRVIAFDTAGFGLSAALPQVQPATMANIMESLVLNLRSLGFHEPIDIAGNSLGGFMALEAAKLGLARTVVAISPAGLWKESGAPAAELLFKSMRFAVRQFPTISKAALKLGPLRELFFSVPVSLGGGEIPPDEAWEIAWDFAKATGFDDTMAQTKPFEGGQGIAVPVTVAFGTQDWLLGADSRHSDELPGHTRWINPEGWGHVPMWKDPEGVAKLILERTV